MQMCRLTRLKLRLISIKFSVFALRNRNWPREKRYNYRYPELMDRLICQCSSFWTMIL